jgi:AraC-like DNA-binding protein
VSLCRVFLNRRPNAEQCPFLIDEDNVIRKAKKLSLLICGATGLQLADEIGLNLKKLKMGFKQIYGDTVYGFLFDYKDFARKLLDSGSYNVNEVGLKIGYSTGSHFIAA